MLAAKAATGLNPPSFRKSPIQLYTDSEDYTQTSSSTSEDQVIHCYHQLEKLIKKKFKTFTPTRFPNYDAENLRGWKNDFYQTIVNLVEDKSETRL